MTKLMIKYKSKLFFLCFINISSLWIYVDFTDALIKDHRFKPGNVILREIIVVLQNHL